MFFVNPKYEPHILTNAQKAKRALEIQSLLMIPKDSRSNQTKREIYEYFIKNPKLIQIQSSKSLRARILCVGEIQLITEEEQLQATLSQKGNSQVHLQKSNKLNENFIILTKFEHDSTFAVIRTQKKDLILLQNQETIRNMMSELKKFSFLKQFQYHELLYLAHFVQKVNKVSYKNYVFEQNGKADCVYFIEQGEFQVFKNSSEFTLSKEKSVKRIKRPRQTSPLNKYLENEDSPYKMKKVKVNKSQLSKIQGGSGQCFGEIQFFLEKQIRYFSLRCNSLSSKIFKINFKHFQEIFAFKAHQFRKLKKQYAQKFENDMNKLKLHKNIKNRLGSPQKQMTQEQQENHQLNKKVSSIILQMDKYNKLDDDIIEGAFTLPNNSLTIPVSELNAKRNIYRDKKLFSQNGKKLSIREGNQYGCRLRSETNTSIGEYSRSIESKGPSLDSPFFPLINPKKLSKNSQNQPKNLAGHLASRKNKKVKGLVDISSIIEEKLQFYNSLMGNVNPEFSFYKLDEKNTNRLNFQKSQLLKVKHQESTPAHSKQYLKQFVSNSLNKSKYFQERYDPPKNRSIKFQKFHSTKTQQVINTTSFSIDEQGGEILSQRYGQVQEPPYTFSKEIRASLVSNDFDKFFIQI